MKATDPVTGEDSGTSEPMADGGADAQDSGNEPVKPAEPIPLTPTKPTQTLEACDGQTLREGIPEDLAADGPWPVGSITTELAGLVTEI